MDRGKTDNDQLAADASLSASAELLHLPGSRVHLGIFIAVAIA